MYRGKTREIRKYNGNRIGNEKVIGQAKEGNKGKPPAANLGKFQSWRGQEGKKAHKLCA